MRVTFKKEDEWDKLLEQFASFDELEKVEFPEPDPETTTDRQEAH